MKIQKSILGAVLGLALSIAIGLGATQLYASAQASKADCPTTECPMQSAKASCPMGGSSQI